MKPGHKSKETDMIQETLQAHEQARKKRPAAPTGKAEQSKGRPRAEEGMVELTDAELQAVSGGGAKPGYSTGTGTVNP